MFIGRANSSLVFVLRKIVFMEKSGNVYIIDYVEYGLCEQKSFEYICNTPTVGCHIQRTPLGSNFIHRVV